MTQPVWTGQERAGRRVDRWGVASGTGCAKHLWENLLHLDPLSLGAPDFPGISFLRLLRPPSSAPLPFNGPLSPSRLAPVPRWGTKVLWGLQGGFSNARRADTGSSRSLGCPRPAGSACTPSTALHTPACRRPPLHQRQGPPCHNGSEGPGVSGSCSQRQSQSQSSCPGTSWPADL